MGKLKERLEIIIGYVALIVSLSAFKNELASFNINVGFFSFNVAQYLFTLILAFLFSLHFYLIPFMLSATRYANLKILSFIESLSYFIVVFLTLSPFFVLILVCINLSLSMLRSIPKGSIDSFIELISIILGVSSLYLSSVTKRKYLEARFLDEKQKLESLEILEFENVQKLFNDGYYSQSILEAFKVFESHLKRLITQKNIPIRSGKLQDLILVAKKLELISEDENEIFNKIRMMRNSVAHLDVDFARTQAQEAISFIKELIKKASDNNSENAT